MALVANANQTLSIPLNSNKNESNSSELKELIKIEKIFVGVKKSLNWKGQEGAFAKRDIIIGSLQGVSATFGMFVSIIAMIPSLLGTLLTYFLGLLGGEVGMAIGFIIGMALWVGSIATLPINLLGVGLMKLGGADIDAKKMTILPYYIMKATYKDTLANLD